MIPRERGATKPTTPIWEGLLLRKSHNTKYMRVHKDDEAANMQDTLKQVQHK
jgi:hypothetical protein